MLEVKDEIIDGKATYNITKNDDGTYSIELATPVIQEGTPLNKKLFNSIMENNIVFTDLDDLEILSGTVSNAGAGWNSVTFSEPFSGVPELTASAIETKYKLEIKSITATGFLYRFIDYGISDTSGLTLTRKTGYLITSMYSGGDPADWESGVSFVTNVSLDGSTGETENTVTDKTVKFSYIAVYNGKD